MAIPTNLDEKDYWEQLVCWIRPKYNPVSVISLFPEIIGL